MPKLNQETIVKDIEKSLGEPKVDTDKVNYENLLLGYAKGVVCSILQ